LKRHICHVLKRNNPNIIWWDRNSGKKNVPPPKKLNGHSLLSILEYEVGYMFLYDYKPKRVNYFNFICVASFIHVLSKYIILFDWCILMSAL